MTAIQSPFQATAGTAASLNVLTTAGDLLFENATPANARLAVGAASNILASSGSLPQWQLGLVRQAATAAAGFALQNATPNIITWTAPADSNLHRVLIFLMIDVSSNMTGGEVALNTSAFAGGRTGGFQISQAALTTGLFSTNGTNDAGPSFMLPSGGTATIAQATALTGGAATVYAEIWGS